MDDLDDIIDLRILRSRNAFKEKGVGTSFYNSQQPATPPSPEEGIIENRGLQTKPATYNYDAPDHVFFKTPTKSPKKVSPLLRLSSPVKTPVRSSPRKRLNMTPDVTFHEDGFTAITSTPKRTRNEALQNVKPSSNIGRGLKALNHSQLVNLISGVLEFFPDAKEFLAERIPEPDLAPIETRLSALQRTVNKSIPRNVWGSQDSSFTFLRVKSHLEAFKKECLEYCDQFLESQHWPTFFEYVFIAWKHILLLPNWSSVTHNRSKSVCLKQIGHKFIIALHEATLNEDALHELICRMKKYDEEETVKACINAATLLLKEKRLND